MEICPRNMRQKGAIARSVSNWKEVETDVFSVSSNNLCFSQCLLMIHKETLAAGARVVPAVTPWTWGIFFTSANCGPSPRCAQCLSWFGRCLRGIPSGRKEPETERGPLSPSCNIVSSAGNIPTLEETWHGETAICAMEIQCYVWRKEKWSKLDSTGSFSFIELLPEMKMWYWTAR